MNLTSIAYPDHNPTIPATPAKTGGAGTGSLNAANTMPHPKPVTIDIIISFIFPHLMVVVALTFYSFQILFLVIHN